MKPSAKAYGANSSGSAFRRRFQRSKVKRIRASVVAQPQQRQRSDAGVHLGGGLSGHDRAQRVARQVEPLVAECVGHRHHLVGQVGDLQDAARVAGLPGARSSGMITSKVGASSGASWSQARTRLRGAVDEQERGALALDPYATSTAPTCTLGHGGATYCG